MKIREYRVRTAAEAQRACDVAEVLGEERMRLIVLRPRRWGKIDPQEVRRLYDEPGASLRSVARQLGVHHDTVRDAVLATGGHLKPVGDVDGKGWRSYHRRRAMCAT